MGSLTVVRLDDVSARDLAAFSASYDRPIDCDAELVVAVPRDVAVVLGAFQRRSDVARPAFAGSTPTTDKSLVARPAFGGSTPTADKSLVVRRGSGGAAASVGPGTVWIGLALRRPDALVACTAEKIINRYVRPLLRALTAASSVPAGYFGRDWISARHRPVALVAFAHDASSGRALFEAIVGVRTPFAHAGRGSFLGKEPATLEEVAGRPLDPRAVADKIADAYGAIASELHAPGTSDAPARASEVEDEPPWAATREEAIGVIAAGRDRGGRMRVGGELMASRDAIARLEGELAALPAGATETDLGRVVDGAFATRGAVIFGVRSLSSIRDVILAARA